MLCLDDYGSSVDTNICPYGSRQLSAINNQNNITFTTPTVADVENPVLFPFSGNYQSKGYRLKVTVSNQQTNYKQTIDTISIDFKIPIPYNLNPISSGPNYSQFQVQGNRNIVSKTT